MSASKDAASDIDQPLLTHAECELILTKACSLDHAVQLERYNLEKVIGAMGHLGEYYNLTLHYAVRNQMDENRNLSDDVLEWRQLRAFVKRLPRVSAEPEMDAIFRKEASLYETLLGQLQRYAARRWVPRCFHVRTDLIVLQHLSADLNLTHPTTDTTGCLSDERTLQQVFRALAAMHASSIAYETAQQLNIGLEYSEILREITVSPSIAWWATGLRAVLAAAQVHPKYQSAPMQYYIERELLQQLECVYDMTNSSIKYRNVLCHRDTWRGNIFCNCSTLSKSADESAILIDYQTARYCPPAIDVIFVMFMNLDDVTRRAKQIEYLNYYYKQLRGDLQVNDVDVTAHISKAELHSSYWEFQLFGLLYKAIAVTILKVPQSLLTNEYVQVDRTPAVLALMGNDAEFRECLEAAIEELVDYTLQRT